jgi:SAM-dependent methyltransferase
MTNPESTQWEKIFQRDGYQYPEPRPPVVHFAEMLKGNGLNSVLDLGCGRGRHVLHMARQGLRVSGMDNAPTALKLTKQLLEREQLGVDLILADMRLPLPFRDNSFDAVLSTQVIHHALLATVIQTAQEIQRVVRKNGRILISVPARKAIEEDAPQHNEIEPGTFIPTSGDEEGLPHHLFTPEEFRGIFPGFEVIELRVIDDRILVLNAQKI